MDALEARTQVIIKDIDKYYAHLPDHNNIDFVIFRDLFFTRWHRTFDAQQIEFYDKVLKRIDVDVCTNVKSLLVNSLIELKYATDAANLIQRYNSGDEINIVRELEGLTDNVVNRLQTKEARTYEEPDFGLLMAADTNGEGLTFRLAELCRALRPLRGGDFIIVAGRPDKGKTSFIADTATHMAKQCPVERPVLWLSNEGVRDNIIKRSITAALGADINDLVERNRSGTLKSDYHTAIGHGLALQIEDICGWTNVEVQELIEQVTPSLLIIDMIDKVQFLGMGQHARTDQKLEESYAWFRELGIKNEYATIATSQISASACENENFQMWPEDHMLKDSRTGKQGACDMIMMLGHSTDPMKEPYRYISTPKNKLMKAGQPQLRLTTLFDKDRARYLAV